MKQYEQELVNMIAPSFELDPKNVLGVLYTDMWWGVDQVSKSLYVSDTEDFNNDDVVCTPLDTMFYGTVGTDFFVFFGKDQHFLVVERDKHIVLVIKD